MNRRLVLASLTTLGLLGFGSTTTGMARPVGTTSAAELERWLLSTRPH